MTAFFTAQKAITQRLVTQWAAAGRTEPVFQENEARETDVNTGTGFIALEVAFGESFQASIGSGNGQNLFRHPGTIFVHVVTPADSGAGLGLEMSDVIAGIFREAQFSGVSCSAPTVSKPGAGQVEGNWSMMTVSVGFYYDGNF